MLHKLAILANHAEVQILTQIVTIIHQLVDIPPHGILGKHLVYPTDMTVAINKYQQEMKPNFPFSY